MKSSNSIYYSKLGLWNLFLACVLPLFLWTLLMAFRDIGWLTERTNAWDAIGVASYGLIFAFVESLFIFIIAVFLGFLIPRRWNERRITLLSSLFIILALWSMADQLSTIWGVTLPAFIAQFLVNSGHPVRYYLIGMSPIIFLTFAIPAYFILQTQKGFAVFQDIFERLSLLSMIYLFFGFVGLIIVILRNI